MGLAGPRNRRKLDHDPNNTRWTRDETTFGQKILRSQGWQPGKFLGAQDATHAQLHTAASLAPIKINLKDDTLGLGAKIRQKQSDECTGLDVFKDLLGRLNGKSEETLEKERQVRSEIKTNLVVERKYGPMRFVSGGLLVGDHMMAELADKKPASTPVKEEPVSGASEDESARKEKKDKKSKKSKKRKASESEADTSDSKREKKRKKRSKVDEEPRKDGTGVEKATKKNKEKRKSRRSEIEARQEDDERSIEPEARQAKSKKTKNSPQDSLPDTSTESSEDVASEKRRRKEKKKEKKRGQARGTEAGVAIATIASSTATPQDSGSSTPSNTSILTPHALSARHRARSRHIASKKMAFGDMQALNQIFMIKPV